MNGILNPAEAAGLRPQAAINTVIEIKGLRVSYSGAEALKGVDLDVGRQGVLAIIGPSGCGKSTLLRAMNRLHEFVPGTRTEGSILLDGEDILRMDPIALRQRVGMVFQRPNPFPGMSVRENVLAGWRINNVRLPRSEADEICQDALERSGLWTEVKDSLGKPGASLSGGQQQRLCIARSLAVQPEVLLLDEPTSALDPIATSRIEELLVELAGLMCVVLVTHNIHQAGRISDRLAFMLLGELVETGRTKEVFFKPEDRRTEDYLRGSFG
jgi:phosphate transport system ATP-binding protein